VSGATRYAIKVGQALYSDGPRMRAVPLSKAKLWTNVGHVKTHLQGVAGRSRYDKRRYPDDAAIVEVTLSYNEREWGAVSDLVASHEKRKREEHAASAIAEARRSVERAERDLAVARETAKRMGLS
jgi:hypothetical protein